LLQIGFRFGKWSRAEQLLYLGMPIASWGDKNANNDRVQLDLYLDEHDGEYEAKEEYLRQHGITRYESRNCMGHSRAARSTDKSTLHDAGKRIRSRIP
jgi:hypothetical protein